MDAWKRISFFENHQFPGEKSEQKLAVRPNPKHQQIPTLPPAHCDLGITLCTYPSRIPSMFDEATSTSSRAEAGPKPLTKNPR